MNSRTQILADLIEAAKALDTMQDALTRAYVALRERHGDEAQSAYKAVTATRDLAFEPSLHDLIEVSISTAARMP